MIYRKNHDKWFGPEILHDEMQDGFHPYIQMIILFVNRVSLLLSVPVCTHFLKCIIEKSVPGQHSASI